MPWICKECKKQVEKIILPVNDHDRSPDIGEPVYRRQTFMGGKRLVVDAFCGPECATAAYEKTKARHK